MRRQRLIILVLGLVGMASLVSTQGCGIFSPSIPTNVVKSTADVDSNVAAIGTSFKMVLDGYVPTPDEVAHWKLEMDATTDLEHKVNTWVQNHKE